MSIIIVNFWCSRVLVRKAHACVAINRCGGLAAVHINSNIMFELNAHTRILFYNDKINTTACVLLPPFPHFIQRRDKIGRALRFICICAWHMCVGGWWVVVCRDATTRRCSTNFIYVTLKWCSRTNYNSMWIWLLYT